MKSLYSLWEELDTSTFNIIIDNTQYSKSDIDKSVATLSHNLEEAAYWQHEKVIIDIKDRKLFIIAFLTLLKLDSKIILIPTEIKEEDYVNEHAVLISDNKKFDNGLLINSNLTINIGQSFNPIKHKNSDLDETKANIYLYTSGSTGKAKLIPKTSNNLLTEIKELHSIFGIAKDDSFYFTPPLYHIYGLLFGLLLPMYASCTIYIDYHFTPDSIAQFIQENNISHFVSIPSYYKMFSSLGIIDSFAGCKCLVSSSAPLPVNIAEAFYSKSLLITEVYGSTETGGIAYRNGAKESFWNCFSYIDIKHNWDEYLTSSQKVIEKIELNISSPTISVVYDPATGFNTGDIIDLYSDSKFTLLGRNTRFVKISGKRVDLKYVQEKVKEYISTICHKHIGEDLLYTGCKNEKIYVIFENDFPCSSKQLKDDLKKHLPGYAVPRVFISHEIPKNNMGKINKRKIEELIKNHFK